MRGEEQYDRIRYKADSILNRPFRFDTAPVDPDQDPRAAALVKAVLEWEIASPAKRFDVVMEQVVWGGLAARMWCARMDWVPSLGPYGDIVDTDVDGRAIHWHPDFVDPHHRMCPWLTETVRLPLTVAARMKGWRNVDRVQPDDGIRPYELGGDDPIDAAGMPSRRKDSLPRATFVKCWYKLDDDYNEREKAYRKLKPDERYMTCTTPGCGYRSMTQGELGMDLPDMGAEPCPDCGGALERQDGEALGERQRTHASGHRLVIVAPFASLDEPIYDGGWPMERPGYALRTFPYLIWRSNPHPTDQVGQSETSLSRSQMCALDAMYRTGYEQVRLHKALTILPRSGLQAYNREPFEFTDAQGQVAFSTGDLPQGSVQRFDPPAMNQAIPQMIQILAGSLKGSQGSSQLGITPQQSKDIPVGTVEALIQTGNVPVDGQVRTWFRELGLYMGVKLDMIRANWTVARAVRMWGAQGREVAQLISGLDLPDADVVVSSSSLGATFADQTMQANRAALPSQQMLGAPGNAGGPGTGPMAAPAGAGTNGAPINRMRGRMVPPAPVSGVG